MKARFLPQDITIEVDPSKSLLQWAQANQIQIKSVCKGIPSCSECRVFIKEGDSSVSPPNKDELSLIGTSYYLDGRRLSCQVRCYGDITVDLSEQIEKQETVTKKIRGFKSNKTQEAKAVNDTFVLSENHNEPGKPSGKG